MINGVHHISLATTDLDRLLHFYRDMLGLSTRYEAKLPEGDAAFETLVGMTDVRGRAASLRAANVQIEFFQYDRPTPCAAARHPACDGGIRHICFDVTDLAGEYRRLAAAGVEFVSAPQNLNGRVLTVYAFDPDGNMVEFQEILPGSAVERVPLAQGAAATAGAER